MASADVRLKTDQPQRIHFAHSPVSALVFTLVSAGFTYACWRFITDAPGVRWGFAAFSLLFVVAGIFGIFWRLELDVDLTRRRVRRTRGFWPTPRTSQQPLDGIDGVWLTTEYRSSGSKSKRKVPWWFVRLKLPGDKKGTAIYASADETKGYEKWEHYAKRLKIDAVDATRDRPHRRSWEQLDDNIATGVESRFDVRCPSTPPAGSTIELGSHGGSKEALLPALGFNKGLVFLALFGSVFVAMGSLVVLGSFGIIDVDVQGSRVALAVVPPVFVLMGLGVIWLGIWGSYTATALGAGNGELYTVNVVFGRRSRRRAVHIDEIEAVGVAGDVRSRHRQGGFIEVGGMRFGKRKYRERENEVVVRSDARILRFGRSVTDTDRAWLADACRYAAVHGHMP